MVFWSHLPEGVAFYAIKEVSFNLSLFPSSSPIWRLSLDCQESFTQLARILDASPTRLVRWTSRQQIPILTDLLLFQSVADEGRQFVF